MKKASLIFISLAGAALFTGCNNNQTPPAQGATNSVPGTTNAAATETSPANTTALTTEKDRESYALGMVLGSGWKEHDVDIDPDIMVRGVKDIQSGGATLLTQDQMKSALTQLQLSVRANQEKVMAKMQAEQAQEGQKNLTDGEAFLAHNKTEPGVVVLPDGLQYKVIKEGTGVTPGPNDIVTVNYRGTFVNGKEFDSSYERGRPAEFGVTQVIPGWTEALEKMKVGSKWDIYVPSNLAYGPNGRIGPNETLIFEVELLDVKARPAPPQAQPLTSDIIKVPSAEDMKKGAKIETIKASDLQKMEQAATNSAATNNGATNQ